MPKPKVTKKEIKKDGRKLEKDAAPVKPVEEPEAKDGEKELDPDLILAAAEVKEDDEDDEELKEDEEDENEFGPDELNPFGDKWEE